jgi:abequosyltransferase
MPDVRLSICIPTYNMGPYIGTTLESIVPQLTEDVEVVILDGASPDDTERVVSSIAASHPSVRYVRNAERGGFDADTAGVIALGRGEFCWLFSADDVMKPGAVAAVLKRLSADCDVYLCGMTRGTFELEPVKDHPIAVFTHDEIFDLSDAAERRRYFAGAITTTAFWSFLSSVIVKRSSWDAAGPDLSFYGSLFAHVAQILRMIPNGLRMFYIEESLLIKRAENDTFAALGLARRLAVAVDGYDAFATAYFPDPHSIEAMAMRRAVSNEFLAWIFLKAKLEARDAGGEDESLVDRLAALAYREPTWRNRANHFIYQATPLAVFAAAQRFNQRFVLPFRRVH